jgi:ubiquinone/menaquinone biosynthesis C-methylase UbiE
MVAQTVIEEAGKLLNPPLDEAIDPLQIIALTPIRPYEEIGDIGCGPGYLTLPLAKHAYDGKVYAIDPRKEMLDVVRDRVDSARLGNVEFVLSKRIKVPLNDDVLDGAVASDVLTAARRPRSLLKEVHRLLRGGAWLAIIDWISPNNSDGSENVGDGRLPAERVADMASEIGFTRVTLRLVGGQRYLLLLRKRTAVKC